MEGKHKVAVFTGAGVSAESGLSTFRDSDGLWARYRIEDVCTPQALENNRSTVIEFYNLRRKELLSTEPNAGHKWLAGLEKDFDIDIVTQNIDDLHERAGSSRVLHLYGELRKLGSSTDEKLIVEMEEWEQDPQKRAPDGSLLRPFVVFFGEAVPLFDKACHIVSQADALIIAGTSLAVYPAASLVRYARSGVPVLVIDPADPDISQIRNPVTHVRRNFAEGIEQAQAWLREL